LPGRSGRSAQVGDGLDADLAGGLVAEGDAAAVDLAEDGAVAGDLGDEDAFAEAHLAHALAKGGVAGEGHYPADAAGRQLAQRQVVVTMTLGSGFRYDREGLYELRLSFIVNAGSSLEADKGGRRVTFSAGRAPWVGVRPCRGVWRTPSRPAARVPVRRAARRRSPGRVCRRAVRPIVRAGPGRSPR